MSLHTLMIFTMRSAAFVPDGTGLRRLSSPAPFRQHDGVHML